MGGVWLSDPIFKIRNIKKVFGEHVVLSGINLDINKGEVLGIIGSSGSGKTTLLHTLIGFLKPEEGEVLVEFAHHALGEATYKPIYKNLNHVKQQFGFASQIPSFYDALTVRENIEYFGSLYHLPPAVIKTNTEILLRLMELSSAEKVIAKNLSGGMERRLDIACSLVHDPSVLFLDEPTADLDPVLRNHIYELIKKINNKSTTIVLASHHLTELENLCDRIAIIQHGKILAVGTPKQLQERFSGFHQLHIQVVSGKYEPLAEELNKKNYKSIVKVQVIKNELVVFTHEPEEAIKQVMALLQRHDESLILLHVGQSSLDDIFISITNTKRKKS